eukprot:1159489-Pelagomonas_calceolata.AAC.4
MQRETRKHALELAQEEEDTRARLQRLREAHEEELEAREREAAEKLAGREREAAQKLAGREREAANRLADHERETREKLAQQEEVLERLQRQQAELDEASQQQEAAFKVCLVQFGCLSDWLQNAHQPHGRCATRLLCPPEPRKAASVHFASAAADHRAEALPVTQVTCCVQLQMQLDQIPGCIDSSLFEDRKRAQMARQEEAMEERRQKLQARSRSDHTPAGFACAS